MLLSQAFLSGTINFLTNLFANKEFHTTQSSTTGTWSSDSLVSYLRHTFPPSSAEDAVSIFQALLTGRISYCKFASVSIYFRISLFFFFFSICKSTWHLLGGKSSDLTKNYHFKKDFFFCPVGWVCSIHRLLLCRGVRPHPSECPWYDTK